MSEYIVGIILAAGQSRRMGRNKLALPFGDTTIGGASLAAVLSSSVDHVIVVKNPADQEEWLQPAAEYDAKWSCAVSEQAHLGQSFSLKTGLKAAEGKGATAAVILLADTPFIQTEFIQYLLHTYKESKAGFVASCVGGSPQPPVLFAKKMFGKLKKLGGDRGAGALIRDPSFAKEGVFLSIKDETMLLDIDTKKQYEQAVRRRENGCVDAGTDGSMAARNA